MEAWSAALPSEFVMMPSAAWTGALRKKPFWVGEVAEQHGDLGGRPVGTVAPGHDRALEAERGVVARIVQVVGRGAVGGGPGRGGVGARRREGGLDREGRRDRRRLGPLGRLSRL